MMHDPSTFKLFVDDTREPPKGWMCARTVSDAIRFLANFSPIAEVSLDHDILFPQHGIDRYSMYSAENFMGVAYYLRELPLKRWPARVRIHTSNAGAAETMATIMGLSFLTVYKPFDEEDYKDGGPSVPDLRADNADTRKG